MTDALETLRKAAAAAGVQLPDEITDDVIPPDEQEAAAQAIRDDRLHTLVSVCVKCGDPINPADRQTLREVRGWYRHRDDGGQNHVIDRRETGRLMCGSCGQRLRAGLAPEQESLL